MVNTKMSTIKQLKELAFTNEEIDRIESAWSMPIRFDDDCPATTPERAIMFKRVNPPRKIANA